MGKGSEAPLERVDMHTFGDDLIDLVAAARVQVVLAAPFIKERVVERLLARVDNSVQVTCITRWRPEEIRAGVSDLGVWDVIQRRQNARLLLRNDLHAKYYRGDEQCLIGSANLTGRALGWSANPNFELLVRLDSATTPLPASERALVNDAILVDQPLVEEFQEIMAKMPPLLEPDRPLPSQPEMFAARNEQLWIPLSRYPGQLFQVYSGDSGGISAGAIEAVEQDLSYIDLGAGLDQPTFNTLVAATLMQTAIIGRIESFLLVRRRFGEMRSFLRSIPNLQDDHRDSTELWQTLMRWLLHFLPSRYQLAVPNHSEIILRVGTKSVTE